MKKTALTWIALIAILVPSAWAGDLDSHPGYADLEAFEQILGGAADFDLDLDQESLAALVTFASPGAEHLSALVENVDAVRARVFELEPGDAEGVREVLSHTAGQLKLAGWNILVSVRDEDDQVEVLFRTEEDRILGFTALFVEEEEAGFANVVGDIGMAQLLALAPNLESLRGFLEEMKDRGGDQQDG